MKKLLLSLVVLVVSIAFTSTVSAQALTTWTWKQYGLSFKAPSVMKIAKNTATEFEATASNMSLSIGVLDYTGATLEDLAGMIGTVAGEIGMSTDSEIGDLQLTTLAGVYIEGTLDGQNVILVVLADDDSNIALWSVIGYEDGLEQVATNVVNSFSIK